MLSQIPSAEEVRVTVSKTLRHHDRQKYAVSLGKIGKKEPEKFKALIKELITFETTQVAQVLTQAGEPDKEKETKETKEKEKEIEKEESLSMSFEQLETHSTTTPSTDDESFLDVEKEVESDTEKETGKKEDILVEVLPASTSNVAKHHDVYRVAITAAVVSDVCADVLEKEMKSSSTAMKQYIVSHYVKREQSTEKLVELVLKSVPFIQRATIQSLLSSNRRKVLDEMVEPCLKKFGPDLVASYLHGCNRGIVEKKKK